MKQLILVRHGHYGSDLHLSKTGKEQITILAKQYLLPIIQRKSCAIYASPANRTKESAAILQETIKAEVFGIEQKLLSINLHKEDFDWLYSFIEDRANADVLIFVTHLEYTNYFASFFAEKLGKTFTYQEVKRGQALIINVDEQLSSLVVPCLDNQFETLLEKIQYKTKNEVFVDLLIAGRLCNYPLTMIKKGIGELTRKTIETDDVDKEADDFYSQERKKNDNFFTILRDTNIKEIFFFFECIRTNNTNELILCIWDATIHRAKNPIIETDGGLVEVYDEGDDYYKNEDLPF